MDDYEERYDAKSETHIFDRLKDGRLKELKELSMALQSMELEMNSYMKDLDIMTTERARIATELDLATSIQAHLLPAVADPFPDRRRTRTEGPRESGSKPARIRRAE